MRRYDFDKCEGCGNDYVYVSLEAHASEDADWLRAEAPAVARVVSDRHRGIGSDGLVLIDRESGADARMTMYNADGSRGEMCGNALRCIGRLLHRARSSTASAEFTVATDVGPRAMTVSAESVEVEMGQAIVDFDRIPFEPSVARVVREASASSRAPAPAIVEICAALGDAAESLSVRASVLSMGNPHCVVFLSDPENSVARGRVEADGIAELGRALETAPCFPSGANIEFVTSDGEILEQRTWERGSGETLACGSGACAVAVAALARDSAPRSSNGIVAVRLLGGALEIEVGDAVWMRGPARLVFSGSFGVRADGASCYDGFSIEPNG